MKKYIIVIVIFLISEKVFSQQAWPINGYDTTTGRPGTKYLLKKLNLTSPIYAPNDSTIAIDTTLLGQWSKNGLNIYRTSAGKVGVGDTAKALLTVTALGTPANTIIDSSSLMLNTYTKATSGAPKSPPAIVFNGSAFNTTTGLPYPSRMYISENTFSGAGVLSANIIIGVSNDSGTTHSTLWTFKANGDFVAGSNTFGNASVIASTLSVPTLTVSNTLTAVHTATFSSGTNTNETFTFNQPTAITGGTNTVTAVKIFGIINNAAGTTTYRGLYYNPTLTNLTGTTHISIETVSGNENLNTTSGGLTIGAAPLTVPADKLEITGNMALMAAGNKIKITEGSNGSVGQTTLVAGTKAITITGLSTSSRAIVTLVTPSGTSLTTTYQAVCTANTLTIQANIAAGTINVSDISVLNYLIIN